MSYSHKGTPWDNTCIESFHALIKREWLNFYKIENYKHAYKLIFEYIESFYNMRRIHSHCGYLSPNDYERKYILELINNNATYLTNSVMMPIAAFATCLLVSKVIGLRKIEEEVLHGEGTFRRKKIFNFMIKYLCPVFALIILFSSVANAFGWITM